MSLNWPIGQKLNGNRVLYQTTWEMNRVAIAMKLFQWVLHPDRSAHDWLRRHSAFWLLFMLLLTASWRYWSGSWEEVARCSVQLLVFEYWPMTYLLLYGVLPRWQRGQHLAFGLGLLGWLAVFLGLRLGMLELNLLGIDDQTPHARWRHLFDATFMVNNSLVAMAVALKVFRQQYQQEQANQQLVQHTLAAELHALQAQVQPHFLFNTLNSIYSLTLHHSALAAPAVRQLRGLLRQVMHTADAADVPLGEEIALLRNYLALEQLRYGVRLTVELRLAGELADWRLAPLLLLPFLENAVKHGAAAQTGPVQLALRVRVVAGILHFSLRNSCAPTNPPPGARPGGLGLPNVRQRLQLLYPGRYELRLLPEAGYYTVQLRLPLHAAPAAAVSLPQREATPTPAAATA